MDLTVPSDDDLIMQQLSVLLERETRLRGSPDREAVFAEIERLHLHAVESPASDRAIRALKAALALRNLGYLRDQNIKSGDDLTLS